MFIVNFYPSNDNVIKLTEDFIIIIIILHVNKISYHYFFYTDKTYVVLHDYYYKIKKNINTTQEVIATHG